MEWLNYRHLYAFWAVCRCGGFRKAAARVHVSQSTISQQVAELEDYLSCRLIERSTRRVVVTDRGAALLAYADQIFALGAEINHLFRDDHASLETGTIRVGLVGGISRNLMFRLIGESLDRHPELAIEVLDGSFDELNGLLHDFELDLILSLERPRHQDLLSVQSQYLGRISLCVAGTPERLAEAQGEGSQVELYLFRHPFEGEALTQVLGDLLGREVRVPVQTDDISLLRFLANSGRGLSVLPLVGVREDVEAGRIATLPVPGPYAVEVSAIYLRKGLRRQMVGAFLEGGAAVL